MAQESSQPTRALPASRLPGLLEASNVTLAFHLHLSIGGVQKSIHLQDMAVPVSNLSSQLLLLRQNCAFAKLSFRRQASVLEQHARDGHLRFPWMKHKC